MSLEGQFANDRKRFVNRAHNVGENQSFRSEAQVFFASLFQRYPDIINQLSLQLPENGDYLAEGADRGEGSPGKLFAWLQNKLTYTESSESEIDVPFFYTLKGKETRGFLEVGKTDHQLFLQAFHYTYTNSFFGQRGAVAHGFAFVITKRMDYGDVTEKIVSIHPENINFLSRIFLRRKRHPMDFLATSPIQIRSTILSAEEIVADLTPKPTRGPGKRAPLAA